MAARPIDPNYVRARAGLLDALDALGPLRAAAVLVGAQAVYEYTRAVDDLFAVAPATFDADLAFVPELLVDDPGIVEAMLKAGYVLGDQPGIYRRDDNTQVDLLVPRIVGGRRGRGAGLGVHGNRAARQVRGLEGALVMRSTMTIGSLSTGDRRSFDLQVAGAAALLVAKIHKLADRADEQGNPRLNNKDAFDVYRLLVAIQARELAEETAVLLEDGLSQEVTEEALSEFAELFGTASGTGTQLVVDHVGLLEDPDFIAASIVALGQEFLSAVESEVQTK
jgi:hypothetical protein